MIRLPLVVVAVSLVASSARADVDAVLGLGVSRVDDSNGDTPLVPALDALVTARVDARWSLGARLQMSGPVRMTTVFSVGGGDDFDAGDYTLYPLDVGVTAMYRDGRVWLAPWLGEHASFGSVVEYGQATGRPYNSGRTWFFDRDFVELGITVGFDVIVRGPDRVALYADYHQGLGRTPSSNDPESDAIIGDWSAATLGVAYHR